MRTLVSTLIGSHLTSESVLRYYQREMFIWIRSTKELLYVVGGAAALVFEYVEEEEPFSTTNIWRII
jgi:hypothetical protein